MEPLVVEGESSPQTKLRGKPDPSNKKTEGKTNGGGTERPTFTVTFGKVDGGGFSSQTTWQKTAWLQGVGGFAYERRRFATKKSAPPKWSEPCFGDLKEAPG